MVGRKRWVNPARKSTLCPYAVLCQPFQASLFSPPLHIHALPPCNATSGAGRSYEQFVRAGVSMRQYTVSSDVTSQLENQEIDS